MNRPIQLLAQADLILLIADLLRPPEKIRHSLGNLKRPNLKMLVSATGLPGKKQLCDILHDAVKEARQAVPDEWSGCYRLLFDGSIHCPVNEAAFIRRDKGAIIGDVCGFYRAFGWTTIEDSGERPDHLLVELEFCAMLMVMAARAKTVKHRKITETALADFARHHLNDWLDLFCEQLKLTTTYPLFVKSADLLAHVWPALIVWHDWIVDPVPVNTVGIGADPENPYECGAPGLVSINADSAQQQP